MNYIELKCDINPKEPYSELVIAGLAEIGYEGFVEEEAYLLAYIPQELYDEIKLAELTIWEIEGLLCTFEPRLVEQKNWNEEWERQYESVIIDRRCGIRASFHPPFEGLEFDIVINPKMSFGTAHHETTRLMISSILDLDVKEKRILDMGTGTGVLGIIAALKGAGEVLAVDNDEWSVENAAENIAINKVTNTKVVKGDVQTIENMIFDVIIANINRNVLFEDIPKYISSLATGGTLLLSGFFENDILVLTARCKEFGLKPVSQKLENNWAALAFLKA